jgi:hypothetical protein
MLTAFSSTLKNFTKNLLSVFIFSKVFVTRFCGFTIEKKEEENESKQI